MKPTNTRIKDIAIKAGVSTGTVDRVIHNRGHVAPDVQKKVLAIVQEMNYEPNLIARALGTNKSFRIAALIPDPAFDLYWLGPKEGVEKAFTGVKQYGISIEQFLFNPYDVESYIEQAKKITENRADGILLSPIFYRETMPFFLEWKAQNIPFVLFNTQISDSGAMSYVGQDSYQSGLLAGNIIHYGQAQACSVMIVHIDEEISNAAHLLNKEQGFRDYFEQNKLNGQYEIIRIELKLSDLTEFADVLGKLINDTPNLQSMYITTSKAYEIAGYLERKNLNHIKLVGYDLLPQNIQCLNKGYISFLINQNSKGQGYWGIQQLVNHLVFKKDVPVLKYLPLDVVTKENAVYYLSDDMIYDDHKQIS
jgi:LacI family transcriptional regulator